MSEGAKYFNTPKLYTTNTTSKLYSQLIKVFFDVYYDFGM